MKLTVKLACKRKMSGRIRGIFAGRHCSANSTQEHKLVSEPLTIFEVFLEIHDSRKHTKDLFHTANIRSCPEDVQRKEKEIKVKFFIFDHALNPTCSEKHTKSSTRSSAQVHEIDHSLKELLI